MPSVNQGVSLIGLARSVSATTTAQRNSTALAAGYYRAKINGASCRVLQGDSSVAATSTNAPLFDTGSIIAFTVPATGSAFSYISLLSSATSTVEIFGSDEITAATQPGAWA